MHTIKPSLLKQEIQANRQVGLNTMIWGGPGIGKSEIPSQIAEESNTTLLDFRANLFDPVDVRGIPYLAKMKESAKHFTRWAVPDVFPIVERDGEEGIFLIDELPTAPPATQNAFLQLLITRVVGDYKIPDGWSIIAAGNRLTDAAAVYQMPSPVRNRLAHYELEADLDDWVEWAVSNGVNTSLISFIRYRPNLLYNFNPEDYAFPTPRSWSYVDKRLKLPKVNEESLFYGVSALVGDGAAGEYIAFRQIYTSLPDIDDLIDNPHTYKKDESPAVMYALTGALAARACDAKMENIMKVIKKLPTEFQVITVKQSLIKDKSIIQHDAIDQWVSHNSTVIL
jgi:hypothetical protein